jgi:hypothetical protein
VTSASLVLAENPSYLPQIIHPRIVSIGQRLRRLFESAIPPCTQCAVVLPNVPTYNRSESVFELLSPATAMLRKCFGLTSILSLLLLLVSLAQTADQQKSRVRRIPFPRFEETDEGMSAPPKNEYTFARLVYTGGWGWRYGSWTTDTPKADINLAAGIKRLTNLDVRDTPFYIPLTSKEIFKYPFLYAVEVGYLQLSPEEADILREYLARGGFFVVDDFHGTIEWANFEEQIRKVLPNCKIEEIPVTHPVFHCFFDIDELFQIPGVQYLYSGHTYEKDGYVAHFRGIFDDNGRLIVMINFNSDLGDAWEWADSPYYAERYTSTAYRLGINYIVYSMTH